MFIGFVLAFFVGGIMYEVKNNIINEIIDKYYSEDRNDFNRFANIIQSKVKNKEAHMEIWKYDQKIGGIGGYATPLNPIKNPFNKYESFRNVYRSLQYARSNMFIGTRPRYIICDTGLHIESLIKILVRKKILLGVARNNRQLGKNIEVLYKSKVINQELYNRLDNLRKILNLAKHDTSSETNLTFSYLDATVFYFEGRNVGIELLKIIEDKNCLEIYKIQM